MIFSSLQFGNLGWDLLKHYTFPKPKDGILEHWQKPTKGKNFYRSQLSQNRRVEERFGFLHYKDLYQSIIRNIIMLVIT